MLRFAFIPHVPLPHRSHGKRTVRRTTTRVPLAMKTKPPAKGGVRFGGGKSDAVGPLEFQVGDSDDVINGKNTIETKKSEDLELEKMEQIDSAKLEDELVVGLENRGKSSSDEEENAKKSSNEKMKSPESADKKIAPKQEVKSTSEETKTPELADKGPVPKQGVKSSSEKTKSPESVDKEPVLKQDAKSSSEKLKSPESTDKEPVPKQGVKMDADAVKRAEKKRKEEETNAQEKAKLDEQRIVAVLQNVEKLWRTVGEKTGAFELGAKARVNFETALDRAQKEAEDPSKSEEKQEQQVKIKGKAAVAFRQVTTTLGEKWNDQVVPVVQNQVTDKLPKDIDEVGSRSINTGIISVLFGLLLLPLFIGGSSTPPEKKVINKDTAALEQKLAAKNRAGKSVTDAKPSSTTKSPFPPESSGPVATTTPPAPVPAPVVPPPKPTVVEKPTPTPVVPEVPKVVTEATVLSAIKSSVGTGSKFVLGSSFDTLAAQPTVVVEVARGFRNLSEKEQRTFANSALQSSRFLGYETISVVESGTDFELLHAGVDIVMADENANLRAQLNAVQKKAEELAVRDANAEASLEATKQRMEEERVVTAMEKKNLVNQLKTLKSETEEELAELKAELAELPDRLALEKRTEEAEMETKKLKETVEVIGRQLTVARDSEQAAISNSEQKTVEANRVVEEAENRINRVIKETKENADNRIAQFVKEADESVAMATAKLTAVEEASTKAQTEAEKIYMELKSTSGKTLEDTIAADEVKIKNAVAETEKSVTAKYQALLDEVKNEAKSNLDRYNAEAKAAAKELSETQKQVKTVATETEKSVTAKYETLLGEVKNEAKSNLDRYNLETKAAAKELSDTRKQVTEAEKKYEDLKVASERTLAETIASRDATVKKMVAENEREIQNKYEGMLREQENKVKMKAKELSDVEKSYGELKTSSDKAIKEAVAEKDNAVKTAMMNTEKSVTGRYEGLLKEERTQAKNEQDKTNAELKSALKSLGEVEKKKDKELAMKDKDILTLARKVDALQAKLDALKSKGKVKGYENVAFPTEQNPSTPVEAGASK